MNTFSPTEAIAFGWGAFKKQKLFWVVVVVLMMTIGSGNSTEIPRGDSSDTSYQQYHDGDTTPSSFKSQYDSKSLPIIPQQVDDVLGISNQRDNGNVVAFLGLFLGVLILLFLPLIILSILVGGGVQMGIIKLSIETARGTIPSYELILSEMSLKKAWRFLVTGFLYGLLVVIGLILLILPGIYFALKYWLAPYFIVDKDVGIGEAFRLSAAATKGNLLKIFAFAILEVVIIIAGVLALFYGLFAALPVVLIASGYAYVKLSGSTSPSQAPPPSPTGAS